MYPPRYFIILALRPHIFCVLGKQNDLNHVFTLCVYYKGNAIRNMTIVYPYIAVFNVNRACMHVEDNRVLKKTQ